MAGPPKQAPRQGYLAIQNRRRPRQAEETVPSVRMTRATSRPPAIGSGTTAIYHVKLSNRLSAIIVVSYPVSTLKAGKALIKQMISAWPSRAAICVRATPSQERRASAGGGLGHHAAGGKARLSWVPYFNPYRANSSAICAFIAFAAAMSWSP